MIRSLLLLWLIVFIPVLSIVSAIPSIYTNYSSPHVISTITIYKDLQYKILYEKTVTVTENVTTTTNSTTTTTTKTVTKTENYTYIVNYHVTKASTYIITVNISGNFSKNFTYISKGNHTVNLLGDIFSVNYPYILPYLLLNNTYALFTNSSIEPYVMSFLGTSKYLLNGKNLTAYQFIVTYNSTTVTYNILENGIIANYSTIYNGSTLEMSLLNESGIMNISINSNYSSYLSRPYLYLEYLYNPASKSLQPNVYVEAYYPFVIGNYIGQIVYLLYPQQGKMLVPNTFYGINVNYELYFRPAGNLVTTYLYTNSSSLLWNNKVYHFVNVTQIKLLNGSIVNTLLYENSSSNITVYLYFSSSSKILLEELIYNGLLKNYTTELMFVSNQYEPINITGNTLTSPLMTTLPYSLVNFNEGLIIAIVFTVVISAVIVLFRQR